MYILYYIRNDLNVLNCTHFQIVYTYIISIYVYKYTNIKYIHIYKKTKKYYTNDGEYRSDFIFFATILISSRRRRSVFSANSITFQSCIYF